MKVTLHLAALLVLCSCWSFDFECKRREGTLTIRDRGQPVLTWRYGDQLPEGIPEDRKRSSYVHPLYGLDGTVLTEDFPKDHLHHRGLSLMWPVMTVDGKTCQLWHIRSIRSIFDRFLERRVDDEGATLGVLNHWTMSDGRQVADETWTIRVHSIMHSAGQASRAIDVRIEIVVGDLPIALRGADRKGYGGLNLRLQHESRRKNTAITTSAGPLASDLDHGRLAWADFSAQFEGSETLSGIAIFVTKKHPGYPPPWTLRYYGDMNVAWPGLQQVELAPGERLALEYRILIHEGAGKPASLAAAYERWQGRTSSAR